MADEKTTIASLIQMDVAPLASGRNLERMCEFARSEAAEGARLILFPELANTGYVEPLAPGEPIDPAFGEHAEYAARLYEASEPPGGPVTQALAGIAREHGTHIVAGLALRDPVLPGVMYNASILLGPEGVIGSYRKIHLWHCEKLYFAPGDGVEVCRTAIGAVGLQVCYDIRFPEVTRSLTLKGAEIVCSVWAAFRKTDTPADDPDMFKHRAYTRAVENGIFFSSCNRSGTQGRFVFLGRSIVVSPHGRVLAASSSEDEEVIRAEIDLADVIAYRMSTGIVADRRPRAY
jgi:predicted amidohydrolase